MPALPETLPLIGLVTVKLVNVPTDVKLLARTLLANVVPVNVPAADVTVISALPLNDTPLIFLAVCNVVAVPALPEILTSVKDKAPLARLNGTLVEPMNALE